jgi:2-methylcitrate dehydratase PrpD
MVRLLVSGLLEKRSFLPRNIKSVVVDTSEEAAEVITELGKAEVAHQVWEEV